jgi:molybdate transport system ATP-binding protein
MSLAIEARARLGDLALDVRLEVAPGECLALAGPSGAGKTSVLRIAAGLLTPDDGSVRCGTATWLGPGVDVPAERRRCGYVFQEYALFGHMSAWRNVAYGLTALPRGEREPAARALLARFGLAARADARPATLSGGERQRVALARALARAPDALLLDEPLSALDARTRAVAAGELAGVIRQAGVPVLLVTHDFAEAAVLADRIAVMDRGRVVQAGTASALAAAPASAFVADFTGASVLTGIAHGGRVALDGGGEVRAEVPDGAVALAAYPWQVGLAADGEGLAVTVVAATAVGGRVRVHLAAPQPLIAELPEAAAAALPLTPGTRLRARLSPACVAHGAEVAPAAPRR